VKDQPAEEPLSAKEREKADAGVNAGSEEL
jgi:hypothetical protein